MKVKALKRFHDLKASKKREKNDEFEVSKERFNEINASGHGVLVEAVDEENAPEFPKHTGGGYYELSNGDRVRGKEEAFKAETELK